MDFPKCVAPKRRLNLMTLNGKQYTGTSDSRLHASRLPLYRSEKLALLGKEREALGHLKRNLTGGLRENSKRHGYPDEKHNQ